MDNENGLFLGWFFGGLFLIYLPMLFISGRNWFPRTQFIKKYPEHERLVNIYTIALMIWIPISVIGTARHFEKETGVIFFLFSFFIPLIGVGIIKGGIEIVFGVSSYVWMRKRKRPYPIIWFRSPLDSWHRLKRIEHRYTQNKERVKRMGAVRILVNIGLLLGLIYFLL